MEGISAVEAMSNILDKEKCITNYLFSICHKICKAETIKIQATICITGSADNYPVIVSIQEERTNRGDDIESESENALKSPNGNVVDYVFVPNISNGCDSGRTSSVPITKDICGDVTDNKDVITRVVNICDPSLFGNDQSNWPNEENKNSNYQNLLLVNDPNVKEEDLKTENLEIIPDVNVNDEIYVSDSDSDIFCDTDKDGITTASIITQKCSNDDSDTNSDDHNRNIEKLNALLNDSETQCENNIKDHVETDDCTRQGEGHSTADDYQVNTSHIEDNNGLEHCHNGTGELLTKEIENVASNIASTSKQEKETRLVQDENDIQVTLDKSMLECGFDSEQNGKKQTLEIDTLTTGLGEEMIIETDNSFPEYDIESIVNDGFDNSRVALANHSNLNNVNSITTDAQFKNPKDNSKKGKAKDDNIKDEHTTDSFFSCLIKAVSLRIYKTLKS